MTEMIIALINQDLARDPALSELKNPVTVDHTPYPCSRCQADCWIGPRQRVVTEQGGGSAICYRCIFKDPELREAVGTMISLNPDIENRPRRWQ